MEYRYPIKRTDTQAFQTPNGHMDAGPYRYRVKAVEGSFKLWVESFEGVQGFLLRLEKGKNSRVNWFKILNGVDPQELKLLQQPKPCHNKPPYFNGAHYSHWKNRMMIFLQSVDYMLWDVIEDGPTIPMKRVGELRVPKERHEWSNQERKQVQLNAKAMHILLCPLGLEEFAKDSSCDNAKEIWYKLKVVHEGPNEMDPNEDIKAMFNRFSIIVNELKGFGEAIPEDKLIWKLIYSLPESWDSKKTTIIEAKNLKE
ncbi:hypothetical protein GQ457_01G015740 [Hibiscus cannabinus]